MATSYKIKEGVFLISWTIPSAEEGDGQATINIEEVSQSFKLSYTIDRRNVPRGIRAVSKLVMDMKFQYFSNKVKDPKVWEPSSVMAMQHGVRQPMVMQKGKWTTSFNSDHPCYDRTLVFDIIIAFTTKSILPMKAETKIVLDHLLNLWKSKKMADVTFNFEEKQIKAHSLILELGSPVMAAMFQNDFKEKQEKAVEIDGLTFSVFDSFLRFIYTGDADLENVDPVQLLVVADKYGVDSLKEVCAFNLAQNLTMENVGDYLKLAHLYPELMKQKFAGHFLEKNFKTICFREDWKEIVKNCPEVAFQAMQLMASN